MGAAIVERSGLSLGVGFDEEAAEVGHRPVDLLHFLLPPVDDVSVERVSGLCGTQGERRAEVDGEINLDVIRPEDVRYLSHGVDISACEDLRRGIDVVQHAAVDPHGEVGEAIGADASFPGLSFQSAAPEDAVTGIASLDGAVEVVPVVEDAVLEGGSLLHTERLHAFADAPAGCQPCCRHAAVGTALWGRGEDDDMLRGGRLEDEAFTEAVSVPHRYVPCIVNIHFS